MSNAMVPVSVGLGLFLGSLSWSQGDSAGEGPSSQHLGRTSGPRIVWGNFDGDELRDLYAIKEGGPDRLFRNLGDGRFEDVTEIAGLTALTGTRSATWLDFNHDQHADLFRLDQMGRAHLYEGTSAGVFEEAGALLGLELRERVLDAEWLDYDADGRQDLRVELEGKGPIFLHGLGERGFERVELEGPTLGCRVSRSLGRASR